MTVTFIDWETLSNRTNSFDQRVYFSQYIESFKKNTFFSTALYSITRYIKALYIYRSSAHVMLRKHRYYTLNSVNKFYIMHSVIFLLLREFDIHITLSDLTVPNCAVNHFNSLSAMLYR